MKKNLLLSALLLFTLNSCKKEQQQTTPEAEPKPFYAPSTVLEEPTAEPTYREDTTTQYEYRVGEDQNGNKVSGNITIKDKYGNGTLTNQKGNTFPVTAEWIGYGKLLAKDKKDNEYLLQAE